MVVPEPMLANAVFALFGVDQHDPEGAVGDLVEAEHEVQRRFVRDASTDVAVEGAAVEVDVGDRWVRGQRQGCGHGLDAVAQPGMERQGDADRGEQDERRRRALFASTPRA